MPHAASVSHPPSIPLTSRRRPVSHRRPDAPGCHGPRPRRRAPACEWLDRCLASRCDDSWRKLLRRYGPRIRRIVASTGGEHGLRLRRAEVEELTQELFVYWLRRNSRFEGWTLGQLWSFVTSSVRHLVIDHVRRLTADKRTVDCDPWFEPPLPLEEVETGERGPASAYAASCGRTPERRMLRREEFGRLWQRFHDHCRQVVGDERDVHALSQAVLGGRSTPELTRELRRAGRPVCPSTVDSWVCKLRRRLEAEGLELPRRRREPEGVWPVRLAGYAHPEEGAP